MPLSARSMFSRNMFNTMFSIFFVKEVLFIFIIKYITKCISHSELNFMKKSCFGCVRTFELVENDRFHDVLKVKSTESFFIFI